MDFYKENPTNDWHYWTFDITFFIASLANASSVNRDFGGRNSKKWLFQSHFLEFLPPKNPSTRQRLAVE